MKNSGKKGSRRAGFVVALTTLMTTLIMNAPPSAVADPGPADVVIQWNAIAFSTTVTALQGPTVGALTLSMVQGAVYDAVNGIEGGYQPYIGVPPAADPGDSSEAAAVTAAHHVLVALYPAQQASLDQQYQNSLAAIPDGAAETGGIEVGAQAATAMLTNRTGDGRGGPFTVTQGDEPGEWRSTSFLNGNPVVEPAPWVGNVRPFLVPSAAALRSDGPNPLTSAAYAEDFAEVKKVGSLTSPYRTADQTDAARFWQANGIGLWNAIFRQLAVTQDLDIAEASRLFAMTNMAAADGAIGCWKDKYYWNFWRPITAIRQADSDGNPATVADPTWTPLFTTPPFPEHPSGHSCVSAAIGRTLQDFFSTDNLTFSAFSSFSGTTRSFTGVSDAVKEILDARVWAGIHFRTADMQGAVIGKKVAHYERMHYFRPVT